MRNLSRRATGGLVTLALLNALGCEREGGKTTSRRSEPAPAPPGAEPVGSAAADSASASSPSSTSPSAPSTSEPSLRRVTAGQLLASIAASGKRATLVNAWASWCGPCRRELPMLQALSINLKPQRVDVILVSVDDPKDELKAASYLKDNGITLESYLVDGSIADFKAGVAPRWPGMLPASFLFDGRAQLAHFWGGEAFENELTSVIDDFLAGRPIAPETRYGLAPGKVNH